MDLTWAVAWAPVGPLVGLIVDRYVEGEENALIRPRRFEAVGGSSDPPDKPRSPKPQAIWRPSGRSGRLGVESRRWQPLAAL